MENHTHERARWSSTFFATWSVIGILLLLAAAGWGLGRISSALAPFVLAFLLVFLLQGLVTALERRGLGRTAAVAVCFIAGLVVVTLAGIFVLPAIGRELVSFANAIPGYLDQGQDLIKTTQERYSSLIVPTWVQEAIDSVSGSVGRMFMSLGDTLARGVVSAGSGIATVVFDLFLGLVIAFWTLKDLPKIRAEMRVLAGDKYEDDLENLISTVGRGVGGYLKGQTVASLVTGAIAWIGLAIAGVPYAFVLGILTYVFNYVPYVGPFFAGLIAAVVGLFVGPLQAVLAIAIVVAAQQVTDLFITPRVMSEQVDLHPILVIFSLLVGGSLFGFWGMIFGIPFAATAKGLFVYYWEQRTDRALATENGALFRASSSDDDGRPDAGACGEVEGTDDPRPATSGEAGRGDGSEGAGA